MRVINRIIYSILLLILTSGIAANLFYSNSYNFRWGNAWIIIPTLLILIIGSLIERFLNKLSKKSQIGIFIGIALLIITTQILILINFQPSLIHDAFRIRQQALSLVDNSDLIWQGIYFDRYPQNVVPTIFYSWQYQIGNWLGLSGSTTYLVICFLQINSFLTLVFANIWYLTKKWSKVIISSLLVFLLLPMLFTYNLLVLYTDTLSMIGWAGLLLIVQIIVKRQKMFRWYIYPFLIAFFYFSYNNKASFIASLVALIIISIFSFKNKSQNTKLITSVSASFAIAILLSFPVNQQLHQKYQFENDQSIQMPVQHWISMGLNPDTHGLYNQLDVNNSLAAGDLSQKIDFNQQQITNRIKALGPIGLLRQAFIKSGILNYGGNLYNRYYSGFIQAPVWYQENFVWATNSLSIISRIGYLTILLLAAWSLIGRIITTQKKDGLDWLVLLTISGISFFVLLWEVNPRYGEIAIPLLILLGFDRPISISQLIKKPSKIQLTAWSITAFISMIVAGSMIDLPKNVSSIPNIVNGQVMPADLTKDKFLAVTGQSSNYGSGYGRTNITLQPGERIIQPFEINADGYQRLKILRTPKQKGTLKIVYNDRLIYQNSGFPVDNYAYIEKEFQKGRYQIIWENDTDKPIKIVSQDSQVYRLDNYSIENYPDRYLIYQLETKV